MNRHGISLNIYEYLRTFHAEGRNISRKTSASLIAMKTERSTAPFSYELINEKRKSRRFLERKHAEENVKERNCFCGRAYYMGVRITKQIHDAII